MKEVFLNVKIISGDGMIIDLNELNYKDSIVLDFEVFKDERLDKRIKNLKDAKVKGKIYFTNIDKYIDINFSGLMVLEDSVTLNDVDYPFNIKIEGNLSEIGEEFEKTIDFNKNTLDIFELLWENIVLEVPISFTKEKDAQLSGNGWKLKNHEETDGCDPRLEKLKELLKGDD